jgi:hypothetical protein
MLRETSIAKMIVVVPAGTLAMATGRPNANTRLVSAPKKSAKGKWRRQRDVCGSAARSNDTLE